VNRVLPDGVGDYFRGWYEKQREYAPLVERTFAPIPLLDAPFFDREVVGIEMLRELGQALYGERDPVDFFYRGRPYSVTRDNGSFILSVELPFTSREQISLSRHADELLIDLGSWRRTLVLPRALIDAQAEGAKFEDDVLKIRFAAVPRKTAEGVKHA
jgi:arsenite-transporting ATPase